MAGVRKVGLTVTPNQFANIGKALSLPVSWAIRGVSQDPKVDKWAKTIPKKVYEGVRGFFDTGYHDRGDRSSRTRGLLQAFMGESLEPRTKPVGMGRFEQIDEISQGIAAGMRYYAEHAGKGTLEEQKNLKASTELFYKTQQDKLNLLNAEYLAIQKRTNPKLRKAYENDYPETEGVPNWAANPGRSWSGWLTETEAGARETEKKEDWGRRVGQRYRWFMQLPGRTTPPGSSYDILEKRPWGGGRFGSTPKKSESAEPPPEEKITPYPGGARGDENLPENKEHNELRKELRRIIPEKMGDIPAVTQPTGDPSAVTQPTGDIPAVTQPEEKPQFDVNFDQLTGVSEGISFPEFAARQSISKTGADLPDVEREQQTAFVDNVDGVISDAPAYAGWEMGEQYAQVRRRAPQGPVRPVPEWARAAISKYHLKHLDNLDQNAEQFMYRDKVPERFEDRARDYRSTYNIVERIREKLKDPTSSLTAKVNRHLAALMQQEEYARTQHGRAKDARDNIYEQEVEQDIPGAWGRWGEKNEEVGFWQNLYHQIEQRIDGGEPINELVAGMQNRYVTSRPEEGYVTETGDVRAPLRTPLDTSFKEEDHVDPHTGRKYKITWGYYIDPEDGSQQYGVVRSRPMAAPVKGSVLGDRKDAGKALDELEGTKALFDKVSTNSGHLVRSLGDTSRKQAKGHVDWWGQIQQYYKFKKTTDWTRAAEGGDHPLLSFLLTGGNIPAFARTDAEKTYFNSFVALLTDIRAMMKEARISNEDATRVMTALGDPHVTNVSLLQEQVQSTLNYLSAKIWLGIHRQVAGKADPNEAAALAAGLADAYGVPKYMDFIFPRYDKEYRDKGPRGQAFRARLNEARRRQDNWNLTGRKKESPRPRWGTSTDYYRDGYLYEEGDPLEDSSEWARNIVAKFQVETDAQMEGRTLSEQSLHIFGLPDAVERSRQ